MEHAVEVWLVDMRQAWPVLLARAVFAVAFGVVALIWPMITLLILAWAFGIFAIVDGAIQIIDGIRRQDRPRWWISLLLGLLELTAGVVALIWPGTPGISAVALAIVVGAWALVTGFIEIFSAVRQRRERRRPGLLLLVGLVSVVAGVVILAWPVHGAVALAALVGGFAVVYGILLAVLALRLRNAAQATTEPSPARHPPDRIADRRSTRPLALNVAGSRPDASGPVGQMRRFGPCRAATAGAPWRCRRRCGSPRPVGRLLPGPCRTPIRERWPTMIRPSEHVASGPEPRSTSERHVVVGRLPAQGAELLPSREDGAKLCAVWGFDSYYRAANERLLRLLGWTEAELSSASYWDFVHPDDRHPLVEALDRIMATEGWLAGYEIRVLGRNGSWRRMQWDIVADRGTELMFGVGAEIIVGESADGVARAPVGTWVRQGRAGTFTWSDELYAMYGIPVGTPLSDGLIRSRIHPWDYPLVEQVWRARLADSEAHGVHFRTTLPDGTTRHLECIGRVMARSGGRAITVRGITIDVTAGPAADPASEVAG